MQGGTLSYLLRLAGAEVTRVEDIRGNAINVRTPQGEDHKIIVARVIEGGWETYKVVVNETTIDNQSAYALNQYVCSN